MDHVVPLSGPNSNSERQQNGCAQAKSTTFNASLIQAFDPIHKHARHQNANREQLSVATRPAATSGGEQVGSSRVDLQACKLEYSIVSPK